MWWVCFFLVSQQQEEEVGAVYKEFVAAFEESGKNANKTWVKGGLVNPGSSQKPSGLYILSSLEADLIGVVEEGLSHM